MSPESTASNMVSIAIGTRRTPQFSITGISYSAALILEGTIKVSEHFFKLRNLQGNRFWYVNAILFLSCCEKEFFKVVIENNLRPKAVNLQEGLDD